MNIKNAEKITLEKNIYLIFGIYITTLFFNNVVVSFSYDFVEKLTQIIRYICYLGFSIKIVIDWKRGCKVTWAILGAMLLSIMISIFSKNKDIFFLVLVLTALRKTDIKKLIKITFNIFIIMFFLVISLALLKIIPDWTYKRGNILRHSLGFYYPTIAIGIFLSIIIMYAYIRKKECTYIELFTLEIINIFMYSYTYGRLSFILITIILGILIAYKTTFLKQIANKIFNKKIIRKIIKSLCYLLPFILLISVILTTYLYAQNNKLALSINKLLSNRIKYTYNAFQNYKITLFGQSIEWNGWGRIWIY